MVFAAGATSAVLSRPEKNTFVHRPMRRRRHHAPTAAIAPIGMASTQTPSARGVIVKSPRWRGRDTWGGGRNRALQLGEGGDHRLQAGELAGMPGREAGENPLSVGRQSESDDAMVLLIGAPQDEAAASARSTSSTALWCRSKRYSATSPIVGPRTSS